MVGQWSKQAQIKMNKIVPEKAHQIITESIKKMVEGTLFGSTYLSKNIPSELMSLKDKEIEVIKRLKQYKKAAAIEGAGTGAGGILLGIADFPLLLSIKMKFIFDAATIYGFDRNDYEERIFMLYVFQLTFSSEERKRDVLRIIVEWDRHNDFIKHFDWRIFQQEYRDYLDIMKLLQLVPGIGAVVGAYVNYHMLESLGEVVMNSYRSRVFDKG